jgi:hypothetical protein
MSSTSDLIRDRERKLYIQAILLIKCTGNVTHALIIRLLFLGLNHCHLRERRKESGQVIILLVAELITLLGFTALAINSARVLLEKWFGESGPGGLMFYHPNDPTSFTSTWPRGLGIYR